MFDSTDLKIILALQKDARTPFSDIAKMLDVSSSIVQIRFNKMRKRGLILGTTLKLDPDQFGVKYHVSIGVKAIESEVQEVIAYMKTVAVKESWVLIWPTFGRYNLIALIMSRNLLEVHRIKHFIKGHPSVEDVGISVGISWYASNFESLGLEKELKR
jgi:Lrp/AsnC family transcriptional regulator, regulator for asnA, asnC and gidA